MNNITKTLLAGAAFGALVSAPAMAAPHFGVTALHAGHQVDKSKAHVPGRIALTYTYFIYSSAPHNTSGQNIYASFYKWNSAPNGYWTLCSNPKQKFKTPKKTIYCKTHAATESYSYGCPSGLTIFHGPVYVGVSGQAGNVDSWTSVLKGKMQGPSNKYKATLNLANTLNLY